MQNETSILLRGDVQMFDTNSFALVCTCDFTPYFRGVMGGAIHAQFAIREGAKMRVHDKADDMWEVSYPNGSLFWTDLALLKMKCASIGESELDESVSEANKCPLGGDITNDCDDCIYAVDFKFDLETGECVRRVLT